MGWMHCTNRDGRECGYGVEATCDQDGCEEEIDRGLAHVCGGMHDGDEHGCGQYFCGKHLGYWFRERRDGEVVEDETDMDKDDEEVMSPQLCDTCGKEWEIEA